MTTLEGLTSVNDTVFVSFCQRFGNRRDNFHGATHSDAFLQDIAQRLPLHKLHHNKRQSVFSLAVIMDGRYVWVIECGDCTGFADESRTVMMVSGTQELYSNAAGQMFVFCEVYDTHSAFTQFFGNSIMRNCLTDHAQWRFLGSEKDIVRSELLQGYGASLWAVCLRCRHCAPRKTQIQASFGSTNHKERIWSRAEFWRYFSY